MTTLIARCASLGWTLRPDGAGWELLGNGSPAAFGSTESLEAWLDKQRQPEKRKMQINEIVTGARAGAGVSGEARRDARGDGGNAMDVNGNDNAPEWGYCQKCKEPAIPCYLPWGMPPDDPDDLLCVDHCTDEGYCWGCGHFCAGRESFDFNPRGLCSECRDNPDLTGENFFDEDDFWIDPFEQDLGAP